MMQCLNLETYSTMLLDCFLSPSINSLNPEMNRRFTLVNTFDEVPILVRYLNKSEAAFLSVRCELLTIIRRYFS